MDALTRTRLRRLTARVARLERQLLDAIDKLASGHVPQPLVEQRRRDLAGSLGRPQLVGGP